MGCAWMNFVSGSQGTVPKCNIEVFERFIRIKSHLGNTLKVSGVRVGPVPPRALGVNWSEAVSQFYLWGGFCRNVALVRERLEVDDHRKVGEVPG
jgi:hypothetical protein